MSLITEYKDFAPENVLQNLWGGVVCQDNWRFGQKSNDDTVYPMWFQAFYDTFTKQYKPDIEPFVVEAGNRFMEIVGDEYTLIRNMAAGNTFGQDGDIHSDWVVSGESLTGVLYLNRRWQDNWGGETIVYDREDSSVCEISKFEAGKLVVFDGSNPHIGKGPQRACGELRCIIAMQAVKTDAWEAHLKKIGRDKPQETPPQIVVEMEDVDIPNN